MLSLYDAIVIKCSGIMNPLCKPWQSKGLNDFTKPQFMGVLFSSTIVLYS